MVIVVRAAYVSWDSGGNDLYARLVAQLDENTRYSLQGRTNDQDVTIASGFLSKQHIDCLANAKPHWGRKPNHAGGQYNLLPSIELDQINYYLMVTFDDKQKTNNVMLVSKREDRFETYHTSPLFLFCSLKKQDWLVSR